MGELKKLLKNKLIKELTENCNSAKVAIFPELYGSDYFEQLLASYVKVCAELQEPIYQSRQELLTHIYIDKNSQILFHAKKCGGSKTLLGGSKKDDPFYDPNTETCYYMLEDKKYLNRSLCNLKSAFKSFYSENEFDIVGEIDISNISIEDFNEVFTPKINERIDKFKIRINNFLKEEIIPQINKFKKIELHEKLEDYDDKIVYIDEHGQKINQRHSTSGFHDQLQVDRILLFHNVGFRIITDITIKPSKKHGFNQIVSTKPFDGDKLMLDMFN